MKKQPKKLTLNKETLRDLTAQNAGDVRGGASWSCAATCYCNTAWCTVSCKSCVGANCHGNTYNKKCLG
jgi:hypothetical protein